MHSYINVQQRRALLFDEGQKSDVYCTCTSHITHGYTCTQCHRVTHPFAVDTAACLRHYCLGLLEQAL